MPSCLRLRSLFVSTLGVLPAIAAADDFRLETSVFIQGAAKPASSNVTLFQGGLVYDLLYSPGATEPDEVALFDPAQDRFFLLSVKRQLQTEVTTGQIVAQIYRSRQLAEQQDNPLLQFMARPLLETTFDAKSGRLALKGKYLTYEVQTLSARNEQVATQYMDFSNWYSKLNAVVTGQAPLPYCRLALNRALFEHRRIPKRVALTLHHPQRGKVALHSEHRVRWDLSREDIATIGRIDGYLTRFKSVGLATYQSVTQPKDGDKNR